MSFALRCETLAQRESRTERRSCLLNFSTIFRRLAATAPEQVQPATPSPDRHLPA